MRTRNNINNVLSCDFESRNATINKLGTSVWLWDVCSIVSFEHMHGTDLDSFMDYLFHFGECTCYFHNLKFDGVFIVCWLLEHGYEHVTKSPSENEFTTLITDTGVWYSVQWCINGKNKKKRVIVEFRDSAKKIPGSVEEIAVAYKLPILKGVIEYTKEIPDDYEPTAEEITYIEHDTEIIARVLQMQYLDKMTSLTSSADTFKDYKATIGERAFNFFFPVLSLEMDDFIRESYRGGVCQVNPAYKGKTLYDLHTYDVNSMYPAQMAYRLLPFGKPIEYSGKYEQDEVYPLYIQEVEVCMKVKDGHMPSILLNTLFYGNGEYLTDTEGELMRLVLTSVDLELMFKQYDIFQINYIKGYKFMQSNNMFKSYILPLYELKSNSSGAKKQGYKIKLNSLYGKFAMNPRHINKLPYLIDGVLMFENGKLEIDKPIYTAVASFITAYARDFIISSAQLDYNSFVYCDTDSLHLTHKTDLLKIDSKKLGFFDYENNFIKAKYLRPKSYLYQTKDALTCKLAGAPKNVKKLINFDNFKEGSTFGGKLKPTRVKGGVILEEIDFTIKK